MYWAEFEMLGLIGDPRGERYGIAKVITDDALNAVNNFVSQKFSNRFLKRLARHRDKCIYRTAILKTLEIVSSFLQWLVGCIPAWEITFFR
jgi:hypothetical protein